MNTPNHNATKADLSATKRDLIKKIDRVDQKFDTKFDELVYIIKEGFDNLQDTVDQNATAIERINLRLGEVAYRFEVKDLEKRVNYIERRLSVG